jgi:hypothetical protein
LSVPVIAVVAAGAVTWPLGDERWAGLGQWAGAAGTVWAVVVALQGTRQDRLDREHSQARLVTVHVEYPDPGDQIEIHSVRVANHSTLPVLTPLFEGFAPIAGKEVRWGIDDNFFEYYGPPDLLAPGGGFGIPLGWTLPEGVKALEVDIEPVLSYVDAEGRKWRRTGMRDPERVWETDNKRSNRIWSSLFRPRRERLTRSGHEDGRVVGQPDGEGSSTGR